jgi:hypothetical protein
VEIAFEASSLEMLGLDDACLESAQLFDRGGPFGAQHRAVHRRRGSGGHRRQQKQEQRQRQPDRVPDRGGPDQVHRCDDDPGGDQQRPGAPVRLPWPGV